MRVRGDVPIRTGGEKITKGRRKGYGPHDCDESKALHKEGEDCLYELIFVFLL